MNMPEPLNALCIRLAITLAHFLWQGAAVALAAGLAGLALRKAAPAVRYRVLLAALAIMAACPVVTLLLVPAPALPPEGAAPVAPQPRPIVLPPGPSRDAGPHAAPLPAAGVVEAPPAPLPTQEPPAESLWQWLSPYAAGAYALGVLAMLARLLAGLHGGRRLRRDSEPATDPALLAMLARQARAMGLLLTPAVACCSRVAVPIVVGLVRPMILLPLSMAAGLSPGQVEAVLAHELAHIRRLDPLVNVLQRLVESLLFYHPGVWFISRWIRVERENCCDDLAVAAGTERLAYAESLLHIARRSLAGPQGRRSRAAVGVGATGKPSLLRTRIRRLLGGPEEPVRLGRTWPLAALLIAAILAGTALLNLHADTSGAAADPNAPAGKACVGPGGVLRISVGDLFDKGKGTVVEREVSESGTIWLPALDKPVRVSDANQQEIQGIIAKAYAAASMKDLPIAVTILRPAGTIRPLVPGDIIEIVVYDAAQGMENIHRRQIQPDGTVEVPGLKDGIKAAGLPIEGFEKSLSGQLGKRAEVRLYISADLAPGDIIDVSVMGLFNEGLETVLRRQIGKDGTIDLPNIRDRVRAAGMLPPALSKAIGKLYDGKDAAVSVVTKNYKPAWPLAPPADQLPLAPEDIIDVRVAGLVTENAEAVLRRQIGQDGTIDLPNIQGRVQAAGMLPQALAISISKLYGGKDVGVSVAASKEYEPAPAAAPPATQPATDGAGPQVAPVTAEAIAERIRALGSALYKEREQAQQWLIDLGDQAADALREAAKGEGESAVRAKAALVAIGRRKLAKFFVGMPVRMPPGLPDDSGATGRLAWIEALGALSDLRTTGMLLEYLEDNGAVREAAAEALRKMSGQTFADDPKQWRTSATSGL